MRVLPLIVIDFNSFSLRNFCHPASASSRAITSFANIVRVVLRRSPVQMPSVDAGRVVAPVACKIPSSGDEPGFKMQCISMGRPISALSEHLAVAIFAFSKFPVNTALCFLIERLKEKQKRFSFGRKADRRVSMSRNSSTVHSAVPIHVARSEAGGEFAGIPDFRAKNKGAGSANSAFMRAAKLCTAKFVVAAIDRACKIVDSHIDTSSISVVRGSVLIHRYPDFITVIRGGAA